MAIVVKLDKLGSSLTDGIVSNWDDRAVRRGFVTGLTNASVNQHQFPNQGNSDLYDAAAAVLTAAGYWHPRYKDMPLNRIRVQKFGRTSAIATLYYRRSRWSLPDQSAAEIADFRTGYEAVKVYRSTYNGTDEPAFSETTGLPSGFLFGQVDQAHPPVVDVDDPPVHAMYRVPVTKIYVPFQLNYNPDTDYNYRQGTVNQDRVRLGKSNFDAGTVRFDACNHTWFVRGPGSSGVVYFSGYYEFTARRGGHFEQALVGNAQAGAVPYDTRDNPQYRATDWSSGFATGSG